MQNEQMTVPPVEGRDLNKIDIFRPVSLPKSPDEKGDLHIHLNGAVPARTVLQILAEEGTDIMPGFNPEQDRHVQGPNVPPKIVQRSSRHRDPQDLHLSGH